MPYTCEACGGRTVLHPASDGQQRCPRCQATRRVLRPPLLVVAGAAGVRKSTACTRLAGTIPGTVLIDADVLGERHIEVASDTPNYNAFWRSLMRVAHEISQNGVTVVYFSVMLPDQVLANTDELAFFDSVHLLCLTASPQVLRDRIVRQLGPRHSLQADELDALVASWSAFNDALIAAAHRSPSTTVVDATQSIDDVERDVREWITLFNKRT